METASSDVAVILLDPRNIRFRQLNVEVHGRCSLMKTEVGSVDKGIEDNTGMETALTHCLISWLSCILPFVEVIYVLLQSHVQVEVFRDYLLHHWQMDTIGLCPDTDDQSMFYVVRVTDFADM